MQNHINLFNIFHYGDIFYSRTVIIPLIKNNFTVNFFHQCNIGLLEDIEGCNEFSLSSLPVDSINTWLGQDGALDENGCSFSAHRNLSNKILMNNNIKDLSEEDYLPEIYYNNIKDKFKIDNLVSNYSDKKLILFCNGEVRSSQSGNIDFNTIVNYLSTNYNNFLFVTTAPTGVIRENVILIGDYTQKIPDLLLIGYLSTFCDIIIGRASGPVCYTHTKSNLMDSTKTFISFTVREHEGKWYCRSKAKQIWSDSTNTDTLINLISNEIQNRIY